jgi:Xaa-Pro aminopeptidase
MKRVSSQHVVRGTGTLNPAQPKPFTLFVQPREKEAETWTGRRAGVEGAIADFGADQAFPLSELEKELPKLLLGAHTLYFPIGLQSDLDHRWLRLVALLRSRPSVSGVPDRVGDLGELLHEMRLFKDPLELDLLRQAADLTRRGHLRALGATRPGRYEYEIEAELLYEYRRGGGDGPGYQPIVASGVNSTILHYRTGRDQLRDGELLLIDSGCEVSGYTADVTRTFPINGTFTRPQQALYECVLAAQSDAMAAIRPGTTREAVHEVATRTLIAGLVKEGLLEGSVDDLWKDKSYRRFYMHGTSHWLGLDVHDAGAYSAGGTPRPLAPGIVLTVEPGLYVAPDDEKAPAEFRGIGIRIEDDVVVTATGCELLTPGIPSSVDDLQRFQCA